MSRKTDLLLLARPDHSYAIYKALVGSDLNFVYCSFKLFPSWAKRFVKNPRVRYYTSNYSNCILLSILHIYRTTFKKRWMEKYERPLYQFHLRFLLPFAHPKIIHYWPNFCQGSIKKYKAKHPEVKTFAEIYYPCEHWVVDTIMPLLEEKGLGGSMEQVKDRARMLPELMSFEQNFLVPSEFIANTYRQYYPDKKYIVIPYGIPKWEGYIKHADKTGKEQIRHFVYAGQITFQKGCDLLMEYFCSHNDVELHLYGGVSKEQQHLFEKYKEVKNIHFHGTVPKQYLMKEVSQYDVGIHMSRFDAYSLSVAEMLGAGLPVLVSKNTGIFFQVKQIGAGLGANLDYEDLIAKIDMVRMPDRYNNMIECLDNYLMSNHKSYEEEIIDFYKNSIK